MYGQSDGMGACRRTFDRHVFLCDEGYETQNTSVQNTRGNKKTSDFQNAAKRKRAVNNVSESNFTDKETMSVVAEQKIQPLFG